MTVPLVVVLSAVIFSLNSATIDGQFTSTSEDAAMPKNTSIIVNAMPQNGSLLDVILMAKDIRSGKVKAENIHDVETQQAVFMRQILVEEKLHQASENDNVEDFHFEEWPRNVSFVLLCNVLGTRDRAAGSHDYY